MVVLCQMVIGAEWSMVHCLGVRRHVRSGRSTQAHIVHWRDVLGVIDLLDGGLSMEKY